MAFYRITTEKFKNYSFIFENISKNDVLKTELAEYGYGEWVREFYVITKIALEDNPLLLESIGKFVRS